MVNFNGKGSCREFDDDVKCPKCNKYGAYYLGSDVMNGKPLTPALDTEVKHFYVCANRDCKHEWEVTA